MSRREKNRMHDEGSRASGVETGAAVSLAVVLAVFEIFPSFGYGRLAVAQTSEEMQGYDADVIYEIPPPDEPDEIDVQDLIDRDDFDLDPRHEIVNLDDDTVGLRHTDTIVLDLPDPNQPDDPDADIPPIGTYIAHSEPPLCTYRPAPEYPDIARQAGVEGTVSLLVFVRSNGQVERVEIAGSSGLESLDTAAVSSAWQSSWVPAKRGDGQPVGVWTAMTYRFVLND
jgi:protein TonB